MKKIILSLCLLVLVAGCKNLKKKSSVSLNQTSQDRILSSAPSVKPPDYILNNSKVVTADLACDLVNSSEEEASNCLQEKGILSENVSFTFEKKAFNYIIPQDDGLYMSKQSVVNRSVAGIGKGMTAVVAIFGVHMCGVASVIGSDKEGQDLKVAGIRTAICSAVVVPVIAIAGKMGKIATALSIVGTLFFSKNVFAATSEAIEPEKVTIQTSDGEEVKLEKAIIMSSDFEGSEKPPALEKFEAGLCGGGLCYEAP